MLGHIGNVDAVELYLSVVRLPNACNGVEKGGFSCAVTADNGYEIAVLKGEIKTAESGIINSCCLTPLGF